MANVSEFEQIASAEAAQQQHSEPANRCLSRATESWHTVSVFITENISFSGHYG